MLGEQNLFVEDVYPGGRPRGSVVLRPPITPPQSRLFAEAILENTSARQRRSPMDWALSLFIHLAILAVLLLVPLFVSQGIEMQRLQTTLLIAPMPPMAAPPPPPLSIARVVHTTPKDSTPGKLTAPTFIPKAVPISSGDSAPPEEAFAGAVAGLPSGVPGGQIGGIIGGLPGVTAPIAAAPTVEKQKGPVRVGGTVKPPHLIYGPAPEYPILARQSRVQGIVVIDAIIDEHGNVVGEKIVSGHPLLVQAALKAVLQRKYEPTFLDGAPTPVDLTVEVTFRM